MSASRVRANLEIRTARLGRQFGRLDVRAQRNDFSLHSAAFHAVELMKSKVAACRMRLDIGLQYCLATFRAGVIDKQGQRHDARLL